MIGRGGERGSGISVLMARDDDDEDKADVYGCRPNNNSYNVSCHDKEKYVLRKYFSKKILQPLK